MKNHSLANLAYRLNSAATRVLCIDDNSSLLTTLTLGLQIYGFDVVPARHGQEALRQFRNYSGRFDAIVTDAELPLMSGLELVRSFREQNYKGPIVLISGDIAPADLQIYHQQGISRFLQKPFKIINLATLIEASLNKMPVLWDDSSNLVESKETRYP